MPLLAMLEQVPPSALLQVLSAEGVSRKRRISRRTNRPYSKDKHSNNKSSTHFAERSRRALMLKAIR